MDPTSRETAEELAACAYRLYQYHLDNVQRATQREQTRIRVARHRTNAPTTHEEPDAPLTRSA
jgi:predicted ATPase